MTQPTPDPQPSPADSFQPDSDAQDASDATSDSTSGSGPSPDPALKGAGLSATGKTADQFSPGDDSPGTTYGGSAGTGTEEREVAGEDEDAEVGQTAEGDVEGA